MDCWLQRLYRLRLIKVYDGVELRWQTGVEVMADSLSFRPVNEYVPLSPFADRCDLRVGFMLELRK